MPGRRQRAREDTWGRLLAPARPACTPAPALRRSHFPDPPPTTLRHKRQPILLAAPGTLHRRRTADGVKRSLLDDGEDRGTLFRPGMPPLTQRGAMRVSPVPTSLRRTRTGGTRRLRVRIRRPQTSPRHDHRQASCSVTVPQTPPGSPRGGGWLITSEAHRKSFLQVKAFRKAMQPRPDPSGTPRPR